LNRFPAIGDSDRRPQGLLHPRPHPKAPRGFAIAIDEQDIENIVGQRRRCTPRAALLLAEVAWAFGDLGKFTSAGGFRTLSWIWMRPSPSASPESARERYRFLGNAALKGSYMALVSAGHRGDGRSARRYLSELTRRTALHGPVHRGAVSSPHAATLFQKFPYRLTKMGRGHGCLSLSLIKHPEPPGSSRDGESQGAAP